MENSMRLYDNLRGIQQLFFEHPLCNWIGADGVLRVMMAGDGELACSFADQCLQAGQIPDCELEITWFTACENTKEQYLSKRPALGHFVRIDKAASESGHYAAMNFSNLAGNGEINAGSSSYIFLALDNSSKNKELAEKLLQNAGPRVIVACASVEGVEVSVKGEPDAPLFRLSMEKRLSLREEIERMAFNTHHVWEGFGNIDYSGMRKRFEKPYNKNASIAYVLSIANKLRSVGITSSDPSEAAEEFSKLLKKAEKGDWETKRLLAKLNCIEHRRWVLDRLCCGIRPMPVKDGRKDYSLCLENSSVKISRDGQVVFHPCMEDSTTDAPFEKGVFADWANWDNESISTESLDPMDRTSVELHRVFFKAAEALRKDRRELNREIKTLAALCYEDRVLRYYCDRYRLCVLNIMDYSEPHSLQYESYVKDLLNRTADEKQRADIEASLNRISRLIFPAIESNLYRDYKAEDDDLNRAIPFIITGRRELHLAGSLGLADSMHYDNQELFKLVASATALSASAIDYIFVCRENYNREVMESTLKGISRYFDYHAMDCSVRIHIFIASVYMSSKRTRKLINLMEEAKEKQWIEDFEVCSYENDEALANMAAETVRNSGAHCFDGSAPIVDSALLNGRMIAKIVELNPYFEFDSSRRKLINTVGCDHLLHQPIRASLQVEDMFVLVNAEDEAFNYQDFYDDYMKFWRIYSGEALDHCTCSLAECATAWNGVYDILKNTNSRTLRATNIISNTFSPLVKRMLEELERAKIISELRIGGDNAVSARVSDAKALSMLKKAGDLLETYVYFEALKTGYFDDIQTGYKFKWDKGDVDNELDCVLTKGFKSILVECKSTRKTSEDYYLILDSLAERFGINCKKVLIIASDTTSDGYETQLARGKQMDIITISTREELKTIGKKLAGLI